MVSMTREIAIEEFMIWAKGWHLDADFDLTDWENSDKQKYINFLINAIMNGRLIVNNSNPNKLIVEHNLLTPLGENGSIIKLTYKEATVLDLKTIENNAGGITGAQKLISSLSNVNLALINSMIQKDYNLFEHIFLVFFAN